jgi:streptogramin lyase/molybdenum-dependent DNA-binding transcriptional regulator ModE
MLELRHLMALRAVAEQGSFAAAAKALGFTQSALSQQIASLEARVGRRLVYRRRGVRAIVLTPHGVLLVRHAVRILDRVAAARAALTLLVFVVAAAALCGIAFGARPRLVLDQPAGMLVQADGSLLVAERGARDRILRVNPRTGTRRVWAKGLDDPFGIVRAHDGSILVSQNGSIVAFDGRGRRLRTIAEVEASPIAVAANGDVFYANRFGELGRIGADGRVHRYDLELSVPHGLGFAPDGSLIIADTGNRRIVAVDPATARLRTVARGLRAPLGLVVEPSGSALVLEYDTGRLLRVRRNGTRSTVARGLVKPYALARARNGTVYVSEAGSLGRPSGAIRRVAPNGRVTRVP